jgi:hypothetical protein
MLLALALAGFAFATPALGGGRICQSGFHLKEHTRIKGCFVCQSNASISPDHLSFRMDSGAKYFAYVKGNCPTETFPGNVRYAKYRYIDDDTLELEGVRYITRNGRLHLH